MHDIHVMVGHHADPHLLGLLAAALRAVCFIQVDIRKQERNDFTFRRAVDPKHITARVDSSATTNHNMVLG